MERADGKLNEILVVEPDEHERTTTCELLREAGYTTRAAASGEEALEAVCWRRPQLVILEVCLPGMCGYEICRRLRDEFAEGVAIIFASATRTESHDRVAGFLLGADDYLPKPLAPDELLARVARLRKRRAVGRNGAVSRLTARESEVLELLEEGLRQREIAKRLGISHKTVGTHLEHMFSKLGARHRLQAVALAREQGLIGRD
jgi:DNA-binding NarL/FixJ family response regulator